MRRRAETPSRGVGCFHTTPSPKAAPPDPHAGEVHFIPRRRLLETTASVESIASQVGYSDVISFVRGFRRAHGMTPRAWRERYRQESG